ncbi:uncharacterized protein LOC113240478 [Hyposmocoma kahamanoa]|uniref:uncharacterized protein LOC113240478 n=1 Tax=Hyposmocoma kahamanoa TaxID=1477025 RepID=UPI000E6D618C|nr:uncharacterized protein LOC113240478 [Hyposmocoma kahamanoa]
MSGHRCRQPPYYGGHHPQPQTVTYVQTPVIIPGYEPPPPPPGPEHCQPTYVTNYIINHPTDPVQVVNPPLNKDKRRQISKNLPPSYCKPLHTLSAAVKKATPLQDCIQWVPSSPHSAQSLSHRAVVAGKEGYDSSPLWVIRAHHSGDHIPGKLAIKHKQAYVAFGGNEVIVHNFEVLCAPAHLIRWKPASNGAVPAGAIPGGHTKTGETLYIARVDHMNSLTPGKVHRSHGCMYISFGGKEVRHTQYEVLCKIGA